MMSVAMWFLLFGPASAFLSERIKKSSAPEFREKLTSQEAQWSSEVDAIMKNMTLGEKAAQMLQIEAGAVDMDTYLPFIGSILYSGNREIKTNEKGDWYDFAQTLQGQASV